MAFPRHPAENCTNHEQLPVERAGANHGNVDGKVRKEKIRIKKSTRDHSRRSAGLSISVTWIVHTRTLKEIQPSFLTGFFFWEEVRYGIAP